MIDTQHERLLCQTINEQKRMSYIEKLTAWQQEIGYHKENLDSVSLVALLGLAGEAGEVLDEAINSLIEHESYREFTYHAARLDDLKKEICDRFPTNTSFINAPFFGLELADLFYYLNILAMNRGLTIEDLARMSYEKVTARNKERSIK